MAEGRRLVDAFLAAQSGAAHERWAANPELTRELEQSWASAVQCWPALVSSRDDFVAHLASAAADPCVTSLTQLDVPGLALAHACVAGIDGAAAAFVSLHDQDIRLALTRTRIDAATYDDVRQDVLVKLLGAGSKLVGYAGRGELGAWVRTVTVRQALTWARRQHRHDPADSEALSIAVLGTDPETAYAQAHQRALLLAALREAVESLEPGDRALLRNRFVSRLTLEQLALVHGAHRATVARGLARLRETLASRVRERLSTRLHLEGAELETMIQWARSRLELSLGGLFAEDGAPVPK
jgi:RNA polymerase sigma-70 factor, ECF subfamily